jgi:hypothetical protein
MTGTEHVSISKPTSDKLIIFLTLALVLILKIIFYDLSTISNDDAIAYVKIANNIFEKSIISVDGTHDYVTFPPGYPLIIGLEKVVFRTWGNVFFFNYFIIGTLTSVLIASFFKSHFPEWYHNSFFPFIVLYPVFITGRSILHLSSEYVFMFFIWIGIYFLFEFLFNKNQVKLLLTSNAFFAFSYLIRPEGIILYCLSGLYTIIFLRQKAINPKILFSYALPFSVFIFPYMIFLYDNLGIVLLSGKGEYTLKYGNTLTSLLPIYIDKLTHFLRFTVSPNFFNPIIHIGILYFIYYLFQRDTTRTSLKKLSLLIAPVIMVTAVLMKHNGIVPRAIYPFIPVFIVISFIGWMEFLKGKEKLKQSFPYVIILIFVSSSISIFFHSATKNHPALYKKAAVLISKDLNSDDCVISRDVKTTFYLPHNQVFSPDKFAPSLCNLKYFLLSNLTDMSMLTLPSRFEIDHAGLQGFEYYGKTYRLYKDIYRGQFYVRIFKLVTA